MCGRYVLFGPASRLQEYFDLGDCPDFAPRYNIAPGTDIAAIRLSPDGKRVLHFLRWGLVPHWAEDPGIGRRLNNARGESVAEKPSFREAFRRRRCLVPADGFFEWKAAGKAKAAGVAKAKGAGKAKAGVLRRAAVVGKAKAAGGARG